MDEMEKIRKLGPTISYGVYPKDGEYCAWANFTREANMGGNWLAYGKTKKEAIESLYLKIKALND